MLATMVYRKNSDSPKIWENIDKMLKFEYGEGISFAYIDWGNGEIDVRFNDSNMIPWSLSYPVKIFDDGITIEERQKIVDKRKENRRIRYEQKFGKCI